MTQSMKSEADKEQVFQNSVAEEFFNIRESLYINDFKPTLDRLYHYTSPEGLIGILNKENLVLRFSRFDCLNDKTEGTLAHKLFNEVINALYYESLISEQLFKLAVQVKPNYGDLYTIKILEEDKLKTDSGRNEYGFYWLPEDKYLCCFSEEPDSLPMWNYYTKGTAARGYNIGIAKSSLLKRKYINKENELRIVKILYKQSTQKELVKKMMIEIQNKFSILGEKLATDLMLEALVEWRLLFKYECFAHEKEVRAILTIPAELPEKAEYADAYKIKFRNNSGYVVPFVDLEFPKLSVQSITVGPQLDIASAANGLEALLKDGECVGVNIQNTEIPTRY